MLDFVEGAAAEIAKRLRVAGEDRDLQIVGLARQRIENPDDGVGPIDRLRSAGERPVGARLRRVCDRAASDARLTANRSSILPGRRSAQDERQGPF